MNDYQAFRKETFRYWEKRRLWYNLALVVPALLGYAPGEMSGAVGDRAMVGTTGMTVLWGIAILGANICYSFSYALEFVFGSDVPGSRWRRYGRPAAYVSGTFFAMILAFMGGHNIYVVQYHGI